MKIGTSEEADMLAININARYVSDNEFDSMISSLNADQLLVFNYIKSQIKK